MVLSAGTAVATNMMTRPTVMGIEIALDHLPARSAMTVEQS
jgi:hypothetical protein